MNRVFPGRPDGGVTEKIADSFRRDIVHDAIADIALEADIYS